MAPQNPPYALQNSSGHTAELFRRAVGSILNPAGGVVGLTDCAVTANSTPNGAVNVAPGQLWIPGQTSTYQGMYYALNNSTYSVTVPSTGAQGRIDYIIAQIQDAQYAGTTNTFSIIDLQGTPSASPVPPSLPPTSASAIVLATITLPLGVSSVQPNYITDSRTFVNTAMAPAPSARSNFAAAYLSTASTTSTSAVEISAANGTVMRPTVTVGPSGVVDLELQVSAYTNTSTTDILYWVQASTVGTWVQVGQSSFYGAGGSGLYNITEHSRYRLTGLPAGVTTFYAGWSVSTSTTASIDCNRGGNLSGTYYFVEPR